MGEIKVVIFANKKDYFLTKLCVASIRYFHPNVDIFIVKDNMNGRFNSKILEKVFNVKELKLSKRYFGWGTSNIHFLIDVKSTDRFLLLDSDIIFIGRVLDKLNKVDSEFIIQPEDYPQPFTDKVKSIYLDPVAVNKIYPEYNYPGYFFNTGQTVVNPSLFSEDLLEHCFNKNHYPYCTDRIHFPIVDQSILNAIFPVLFKKRNIEVGLVDFMKWSSEFYDIPGNEKIESFLDGNYEFLVHYAGDMRVLDFNLMKGSSLLNFFKNYYEKQLNPFQLFLSRVQDRINSKSYMSKIFYYKNRIFIKLFNL